MKPKCPQEITQVFAQLTGFKRISNIYSWKHGSRQHWNAAIATRDRPGRLDCEAPADFRSWARVQIASGQHNGR